MARAVADTNLICLLLAQLKAIDKQHGVKLVSGIGLDQRQWTDFPFWQIGWAVAYALQS